MQYLLLSLLLIFQLSVSAQWSEVQMPRPNVQLSAVSLSNKIYLAGGNMDSSTPMEVIDIYDVERKSWEEKSLGEAKLFIAAVNSENKLIFGGGLTGFFPTLTFSNLIEVYDPILDEWDSALLSEQKITNAVISNNKVFFGGGMTGFSFNNNVLQTTFIIDIYDLSTNEVTQDTLSEARALMAAAATDNIVLFAGGSRTGVGQVSDRVDIYDVSREEWTTAQLSEARTSATAVAIGDKILIAGGNKAGINNSSNRVDIYDTVNNTWTTATLSEARGGMVAGVVGNKAYFIGGGDSDVNSLFGTSVSATIDIYDATTGTWSTDKLLFPRVNHSVAATDNQLFVAGGVSDITSETSLDIMEVFTDTTVVISSTQDNKIQPLLTAFPNPATDQIAIELPDDYQDYELSLSNLQGEVIISEKIDSSTATIDVSRLAKGIYVFSVTQQSGRKIYAQKILIQ